MLIFKNSMMASTYAIWHSYKETLAFPLPSVDSEVIYISVWYNLKGSVVKNPPANAGDMGSILG